MTLSKTKQLTFPFPIIIVILIFFFPFWLKGKIPIPADTIVGMYHPFRDTVKDRYPSGVPFKNFLITDPVRQTYLWKKLAIDYFKEKKWPLWNPYTHSGTPLLANFQTGAFYPLNLLFFIFDFNLAWGIYIAFQPLLGGFFMYYFLKNFKLSSLACLLGSLSFIFGGFSIAWLEWGNIGHTALWLPLILLSIDKSITFSQKKLSKWIIIFLFSLTSSLFAGHLQTFIYLLIFTSIYLFFRIQTNFKKKKLKIYLLFLLLFFIFIALTAVQWIPTLEFIKLSNRFIDQEQLAKSFSGFLPFENLIQLIIPDFFGNPATLNYWGKWNYGEFVSFLGTVPLFFVILALFNLNSQKLRKLILFFFFMIILSLLFSLPTPIGKLSLFLNLPLISSAQPSRLIYLLDFSLACLAAVGFNIFLKNLSKNRIFIRILFPLIFFLLFFAFVWTILLTAPKILPQSLLTQNIIISKRNSILPTIIFILFFFSLIIAWWKKNFARTKNIITILIFVLAIVDLLRFSFKFTPFSQKEWIFPKTKTTDFLIQNNQLYRYMVLDRRIFPPNYSIFYGLKTVEGYDPLYLYSYAKLKWKQANLKRSLPLLIALSILEIINQKLSIFWASDIF
jgi:hypothetical protein